MRTARRWWYAVKPSSWPKLLVPALLGQAIGVAAAGRLSTLALALGLAFTVCDLLFLVFLNDWGDQAVDRLKRAMFPEGCSPKTIPDGILSSSAVLGAGLTAGAAMIAISALAGPTLERPHSLVFGVAAALLFLAYTFPPLRLNYCGGGEILEMIGVGLLLPAYNAYLQSGALWVRQDVLLIGTSLFALSSALASGLSDEQSDRQGGKRTFTTLFGNAAVRRAAELALAAGAVAWILAPLFAPIPWIAIIPAVSLVTWHGRSILDASRAATRGAFREQGRYKQHLHRAIWDSGLVLALVTTLVTFVG